MNKPGQETTHFGYRDVPVTEKTRLVRGVFDSVDAVAGLWGSDAVFEPSMPAEQRDALYRGWQDAVGRVRS